MRKEQERLAEELTNTRARLSDAEKKVDMSNVKAVLDAQAAKEAAEQKAVRDIADYKVAADKRISDANNARITSINKAKEQIAMAKKSKNTAWGSLIATLFCCNVAYPTFLYDIWGFSSELCIWLWGKLNDYAIWLETPYYSILIDGVEKSYVFSIGWAWILRIITFILILASMAGICYGVYQLGLYYKKRWCNLSLRVLLASLAEIIIFGEGIRKYVNLNLVLLLIIIQLIYLGMLVYLDGYFDNRNRMTDWQQIQNL